MSKTAIEPTERNEVAASGDEPSEAMKAVMEATGRRRKGKWEERFERLAVGKSFTIGLNGDYCPLEPSVRVMCYKFSKRLGRTFRCVEHLENSVFTIEVARID